MASTGAIRTANPMRQSMTYDCFTNRFIPEGTDYYNTPKMPGNPATGPLYIEGAKEGDMLKIDILDIETGPTGIVMLGPNNGNEREFFEKRIVKRVPVRDGFAWYDNKITIPVQPMIGVIGVAPKGEGVSTVTPLDHGGNSRISRWIVQRPCLN